MAEFPLQAAWNRVAQGNVDSIKERILTGYRDGLPFVSDTPGLIKSRYQLVLDFGCGLGRNFSLLKSISDGVHGYDLPDMVARCRNSCGQEIDLLTADWLEIANHYYPLVYASLVVQHLDLAALDFFLIEWASIASHVYLHTRCYLDDGGGNVLGTILASSLFSVERCSIPVSEAVKLCYPNEAHFQVLLKSLK